MKNIKWEGQMILKAKKIYGSNKQFIQWNHGTIERLMSEEEFKNQPLPLDYDYSDHVIYPAFNDSHMHFIGFGMKLNMLTFDHHISIPDILKDYSTYAASCEDPWVIGRGWNQDQLVEHRLLHRSDLDHSGVKKPTMLLRTCGHIGVVNTAGLKALGILSERGEPNTELLAKYQGKIDMAQGMPTGILRESALDMIEQSYSLDTLKKYILDSQHKLLSYGIGSVQSDDLYFYKDKEQLIDFFRTMEKNGELKIRVYQQAQLGRIEELKEHIEKGYRQEKSPTNQRYKNGPMKILSDGSLGARTAYMAQNYEDLPDDSEAPRGIMLYTKTELKELIGYCAKHDIDTAIHAIGNGAIQILLDIYEGRLSEDDDKGGRQQRQAIVHSQIMSGDQIKQMGNAHVGGLVQPVFLGYDSTIVKQRVGESLATTSYAYRSMIENGIRLGFGSDAPVEDPNPLRSIYYAVNRSATYCPEEAVNLDQAIRCFTEDAAYFSYEESVKGKLAPHYFADFVVMEKEIPDPTGISLETFLQNQVIATIVDGMVYSFSDSSSADS